MMTMRRRRRGGRGRLYSMIDGGRLLSRVLSVMISIGAFDLRVLCLLGGMRGSSNISVDIRFKGTNG